MDRLFETGYLRESISWAKCNFHIGWGRWAPNRQEAGENRQRYLDTRQEFCHHEGDTKYSLLENVMCHKIDINEILQGLTRNLTAKKIGTHDYRLRKVRWPEHVCLWSRELKPPWASQWHWTENLSCPWHLTIWHYPQIQINYVEIY